MNQGALDRNQSGENVQAIHPGRLHLAETELIKLYDLIKDQNILTSDKLLAQFPYLNGLIKKRKSSSRVRMTSDILSSNGKYATGTKLD